MFDDLTDEEITILRTKINHATVEEVAKAIGIGRGTLLGAMARVMPRKTTLLAIRTYLEEGRHER